jgi:ADP-dependent phosphofructokinase/glucokinase
LAEVANDTWVVLLGGIEKLTGLCFTSEVTEFLQTAFIAQIREFSTRNIQIHLELSGWISGDRLTILRKLLLSASVMHIGMNRDQLSDITSESGSEYYVFGRQGHFEGPIDVYTRGAELLRRLRLETLYVHDSQLDMCLIRSDRGGDGVPQELLARHRQAMLFAKAAVPAAIVARSGAGVLWEMVFSTESLAAFIVFSRQYAALVAPSDGTQQEVVQEAMLTHGYYRDPVRGILVVIAPTVYVEFPPTVDLVGAGDMSFAARAVTATAT